MKLYLSCKYIREPFSVIISRNGLINEIKLSLPAGHTNRKLFTLILTSITLAVLIASLWRAEIILFDDHWVIVCHTIFLLVYYRYSSSQNFINNFAGNTRFISILSTALLLHFPPYLIVSIQAFVLKRIWERSESWTFCLIKNSSFN